MVYISFLAKFLSFRSFLFYSSHLLAIGGFTVGHYDKTLLSAHVYTNIGFWQKQLELHPTPMLQHLVPRHRVHDHNIIHALKYVARFQVQRSSFAIHCHPGGVVTLAGL